MSMIQGESDVSNAFLSRREITCNFNGLGGKLTKIKALEMVTKEYGLDGKTVVPIRLKNHIGRTKITGTFYVYEDEALAKSHVDPNIFSRLEKANAKVAEKAKEIAKTDASEEKANVKTDASKEKAESEEKAKEIAKTDASEEKANVKTDASKEKAESEEKAKEIAKTDASEEKAEATS
ncbi:MAG: hypothetical protein K8823_819 [Cenarchaeum symbiont of Oopsacas minuta]|nr:hypothetical protein [Cenarchaeum symbiont of Oopsacas minuta]